MKQKGFTIIELIVVIAIIAILAGIIIVNVSQYQQKAKVAWAVGQINQIQKALEMYKNDHGYYPYQMGEGGDLDNPAGIDAGGCSDFSTNFVDALSPLVINGYISQIKDYNNDSSQSCGTSDGSHHIYSNFFEYQTINDTKFRCGGEQMNAAYYILIGSSYPINGLKSVGYGSDIFKYYYCIPSSS